MKLKLIKNISNDVISLKIKNGYFLKLHPDGVLEDIDVTNVEELRDKIDITSDLTEVTEPTGMTKLRD